MKSVAKITLDIVLERYVKVINDNSNRYKILDLLERWDFWNLQKYPNIFKFSHTILERDIDNSRFDGVKNFLKTIEQENNLLNFYLNLIKL